MLPAIPATSRLSDSSDSNAEDPNSRFNNEPFVNIAECTSLHEGRQQISTILPVNIDTLFHTLYARSKFLEDFHASRKIFDIEHTDWRLDEDTNKRRRTFKCKMPIKASFGPKFSCITEIQTLRECSIPGSLYSIDITSFNENVPYADVFTIYVHHCLVRTVDDHTMLSVYLDVKFRKSCFSVIKSLIEKTTYSGVEDFHNDLALQLSRHFCTPTVRHKRHIRNHSRSKTSNDALDENAAPKANATHQQKLADEKSSTHQHHHHHHHRKPTPKTATGIATYSARELFIQQNIQTNGNGNLTNAMATSHRSSRSAACWLMVLMIVVSLVNVGLFVRLHTLNETSLEHFVRNDLFMQRDIRPQDVANLSSDQWIRMFYSYHVQHQNRIEDMRRLLITSITSLKKMEETMLAMMVSILPVQKLNDDDNNSQRLRPYGKSKQFTLDATQSDEAHLGLNTEEE